MCGKWYYRCTVACKAMATEMGASWIELTEKGENNLVNATLE